MIERIADGTLGRQIPSKPTDAAKRWVLFRAGKVVDLSGTSAYLKKTEEDGRDRQATSVQKECQ